MAANKRNKRDLDITINSEHINQDGKTFKQGLKYNMHWTATIPRVFFDFHSGETFEQDFIIWLVFSLFACPNFSKFNFY